MSFMVEFQNGGAPGISAEELNVPFHLNSVTYDSTNDRLVLVLGKGREQFLDTIIEKTGDTTYYIDTPAINTTYYIYLKSDGTFTHNTNGIAPSGAILLWTVATGSTVDSLTKSDKRGLLGYGSGKVVQDNLETHENDIAAHEATSANIASRIVARDASGNFAAGTITATLAGSADKVDNIDFRIYNGSLQYNDGSGWKDVAEFKNLSPKIYYASITTNQVEQVVTLINVSGAGYLTGLAGTLNSAHNLRVTIDGTVIHDESIINSIAAIHRFNSSFKLELRSVQQNTNSFTSYVACSYLLD